MVEAAGHRARQRHHAADAPGDGGQCHRERGPQSGGHGGRWYALPGQSSANHGRCDGHAARRFVCRRRQAGRGHQGGGRCAATAEPGESDGAGHRGRCLARHWPHGYRGGQRASAGGTRPYGGACGAGLWCRWWCWCAAGGTDGHHEPSGAARHGHGLRRGGGWHGSTRRHRWCFLQACEDHAGTHGRRCAQRRDRRTRGGCAARCDHECGRAGGG